jgi:hypothetical protein
VNANLLRYLQYHGGTHGPGGNSPGRPTYDDNKL